MKIVEETPWRLRIEREGRMRVPGIVFLTRELLPDLAGDKSLEQVANVASLPGILRASYAMPDMHWGYGFPIGGVAATDVDAGGAQPTLTWRGCVLMPDGLEANSVASFADGSLVATVLFMPGKTFLDSVTRKPTGAVFEWSPGDDGFTLIEGSELPANNGIEVSADGREIYVASSGLQTIVAFAMIQTVFPAASLTIAGHGPQEPELKHLAQALSLRNVRFLGAVDPLAMPNVYDRHAILLNSSFADNQPLSVLEAAETLSKRDGYTTNGTDNADMERQWPQLKGQFLIDRDSVVRWLNIECAREGVAGIGKFPSSEEILAAARAVC